MASVDVLVRGAGIIGLSVAWAMVRAGARVELVDPAGPGAGASGGVVGALAPHVPENWNAKKQFQFESLVAAADFWAEVSEVSGRNPGYSRTGRVQPLGDDAAVALARARGEGAAALWAGAADWIVTREPSGWAVPSATGHYIHDTLSAQIHPRWACAALAAALAARGVACRTAPKAPAASTVWATGAEGLDALSAQTGRSVGQGIKGQAALLAADFSGRPQLFIDGLHVIAHSDRTVAVGSTTEREFDDAAATDGALEALIAKVRAAVPELRDAPVVERWAGLRPRARSRAPMLGEWPERPGNFIANGGFKIGFGMAPGIAAVMAALVLEGRDTVPEGFRVEASL